MNTAAENGMIARCADNSSQVLTLLLSDDHLVILGNLFDIVRKRASAEDFPVRRVRSVTRNGDLKTCRYLLALIWAPPTP